MLFGGIKHPLSCVRKAVDDYRMINPGDRIAVGLSGGKDSIALLALLINLKKFYPADFTLCGITVSMGFEGEDFSQIGSFCEKYEIEYKLVKSNLADVIFNNRKESNPCSLCARMRRGMLHDNAKLLSCNKLALGHHFDDAIDTFALNLVNEGRLASFYPVTYLSRKDITVIRPMIYLPETDISDFASAASLPVCGSLCPEDKNTERENVHNFIAEYENKIPGLKKKIFGAIEKGGLFIQKSLDGEQNID